MVREESGERGEWREGAWLRGCLHTRLLAPVQLHNPEMRAALVALGIKTDSSIIESWPSTTSPSSSSRLWPYSMSSGIVQNCQVRFDAG